MRLLRLIAFLFAVPSAWAGESVIVGKNRAGLNFEFSFYFGDSEVLEEPKQDTGQVLSVVVWKYMPVPKKNNTVTRENIGSEYVGVCHFYQQEAAEVIRCNANAPLGLANVVYANRKKNGVFQCKSGCNRATPAILKFEDVPNGC